MSQSSRTASLTIADRYARAAFALGVESQKETTVAGELATLARAVEENASLRDALANPLVGRGAKAAVLGDLAKNADPLTQHALAAVAEGGRAELLPAISKALDARLSAARGELVAEITSARPLSGAMQKKLTQSLESATGKKIRLALAEDPRLLGGVTIQLGSLRLDATLAGALNTMRADLLAQTA